MDSPLTEYSNFPLGLNNLVYQERPAKGIFVLPGLYNIVTMPSKTFKMLKLFFLWPNCISIKLILLNITLPYILTLLCCLGGVGKKD